MENQSFLKTLLVIAALIIVGLLLLLYATSIGEGFWYKFLNSISVAILISGVWAGINQLITKKDYINLHKEQSDRIINVIGANEGSIDVGLNKIVPTADKYDYKDLILNANELTVLLNDGRTWLNWNIDSMQKRLLDKKRKTTFILLHPDSNFIKTLSTKVDSHSTTIVSKINETMEMLRQNKNESTIIKVYGHHLFNSHSIFLTENTAVMIPYTISRTRQLPIVFEFKKNESPDGYYMKIRNDITALLNDCTDLNI